MMHQEIMGAQEGQQIDHVNGNGLDNRRDNLRFCTQKQNNWNSFPAISSDAPYRGVKRYHCKGKGWGWTVRLMVEGEVVYLGWYKHAYVAAKAYDFVANLAYGEFAPLNFPKESESA